MFTTAFSVEVFMSRGDAWVKITVGIALALMILPISWGIWATFEARAGFSILSSIDLWKSRLFGFTRGVPESGPGDGGDLDGQGNAGKLRRSRTMKEMFNFIRRSPREKGSTSSKCNLTGSNGSCRSPGSLGMEGEMNSKEQGSAV